MKMINLHNHTIFSDGSFQAEEIIKFAVKSGIKHLGISEHYSTTKIPNKCVNNTTIDKYIQDLKHFQDIYKNKIKIYIGLEIDFSIIRCDFTSLVKNKLSAFDFLLFEHVEDSNLQGLSLDELIKIKDFFPSLIGLAHNDIEKNFGRDNFPQLCDKLEKNNIFLELSTAVMHQRGITPYYYFAEDFFMMIRNRKIPISIGSDTHHKIEEVGNINNALDFIRQLKLEDNLNILIKNLADDV